MTDTDKIKTAFARQTKALQLRPTVGTLDCGAPATVEGGGAQKDASPKVGRHLLHLSVERLTTDASSQ